MLFTPEKEYNLDLLSQYKHVFYTLLEEGHHFHIVVGGGYPARSVSQAIRSLHGNQALADQGGILASRLNALLISSLLGSQAISAIPTSFEEVLRLLPLKKIIVTGGLQPGQSTNAVAAILAEASQARALINLSNITHVYTKDPKKYPHAKPLKELSYNDLITILESVPQAPGRYDLFDRVGLNIVKRSNIPLYFANGKNPQNLLKIIHGENPGSMVRAFEGDSS